MRNYLVLFFLVGVLQLGNSQVSLNIEDLKLEGDSTTIDWYRAPSLRWNATGLLNTFVPAVSLVYEYPFSKRIGVEVEGGPLVPYSQASFEGEKFNGFRFRVGPKVYLAFDESDLFYVRLSFRYDRANSLSFKRVLDPSASFTQDQLIEGQFENIGWLLFAGYMTDFGKSNRFVLDTSVGFGWTRWNEQLEGVDSNFIIDETAFFERNREGGSAPVISFNLQFGYRF